MPAYSVSQFFRPTDQEIVGLILHNLLLENQPLAPPLDAIIRRFNPFGSKLEPAQIWKKNGGDELVDQDLYFLADIKAKNRLRINRKVGSNGTWSQGEISKPVELAGNPNPIGLKRKFRFEDKKSKKCNEDGAWFIDEYSLFDGPKDPKADKKYDFDLVICRMRRNGRVPDDANTTRKRKSSSKPQSKNKKLNPRKKMKKDDESDDDQSDESDDDQSDESDDDQSDDESQVIESQEDSSSDTMMIKVAADEDHQMMLNSGVDEHATTSDVVDSTTLLQGISTDDLLNPESFDDYVPDTTFDVDEFLATWPHSELGDKQVNADDDLLKSLVPYGIDLDSFDNFPNTTKFFDLGDFLADI